MLLIVFLALFAGCLAMWAAGLPALFVFGAALATWCAFTILVYPKIRTYKTAMGIDDKLRSAEATGWSWLGLHLAGLKVIALGAVTSAVPFISAFASWASGQDLGIFFDHDVARRLSFWVGALVFALPFLTSWLHIGAIKDAAETTPKDPIELSQEALKARG